LLLGSKGVEKAIKSNGNERKGCIPLPLLAWNLPFISQGQLTSTHNKMVKLSSKYLRYALFNATKYVCHWDAGFD